MTFDEDSPELSYFWYELRSAAGSVAAVVRQPRPTKSIHGPYDDGRDDEAEGEECMYGQAAHLSLRYEGPKSSTHVVIVSNERLLLFDGHIGSGQIIDLFAMTPQDDLGKKITVKTDGKVNASFRTDGLRPIGPGLRSGNFLVVSGTSVDGASYCQLGPVPLLEDVWLGNEMVIARTLFRGLHRFHLAVSDGPCASTDTMTVEVVTPGEAVRWCGTLLDQFVLRKMERRRWSDLVESAATDFDHHRPKQGLAKLRAFAQTLRMGDVRKIGSEDANHLADCLEQVMAILTRPQ